MHKAPAPSSPLAFPKSDPPAPQTCLMDTERECLRQEGGCFRCQKTGHLAHHCPQQTLESPKKTLVPQSPQHTSNTVIPKPLMKTPKPVNHSIPTKHPTITVTP